MSRVLLEKVTVTQLVEKFLHSSYGIQKNRNSPGKVTLVRISEQFYRDIFPSAPPEWYFWAKNVNTQIIIFNNLYRESEYTVEFPTKHEFEKFNF
jgi:hypothetical protein